MTFEERARQLGNELTEAVDAVASALADMHAALIGRSTSMAAGTVVRMMERLDALEERVAALEQAKEHKRGGDA